MVDINSFFGNDSDDSNEKLNKMNQQRFELNALPPPPLNEDDEPIVINVTVQTNTDNDFVNFQMGEFCSWMSRQLNSGILSNMSRPCVLSVSTCKYCTD